MDCLFYIFQISLKCLQIRAVIYFFPPVLAECKQVILSIKSYLHRFDNFLIVFLFTLHFYFRLYWIFYAYIGIRAITGIIRNFISKSVTNLNLWKYKLRINVVTKYQLFLIACLIVNVNFRCKILYISNHIERKSTEV